MPFTDIFQQRDIPLMPLHVNQQFATLANTASLFIPLFVNDPVPTAPEKAKSFWFEGFNIACSLSVGTITNGSGVSAFAYIAPFTWGDALGDAASAPTTGQATYLSAGGAVLGAENTIYKIGRTPAAAHVNNDDANLIPPGHALFARFANATGGNLTGNLAITAWIRGRQGQ